MYHTIYVHFKESHAQKGFFMNWFRCLTIVGVLFLGAMANASRPNVVLILADDLGWADVGYHGGSVETPNIDRLASEGVRLERFYVNPLCSPTRAALMTGRWPMRYGMMSSVITPWRRYGLPVSEQTLGDLMSEGGYARRGVVGKWHIGHYKEDLLPLNRGFTHFYGHYNGALDYFTHIREGELDWHRNLEACRDEGYSTDLIGHEAAQFIAESLDGEPFFLYVPFNAPHNPLQAKDADIAKYDHVDDDRNRNYFAMIDSLDQAIGNILEAIQSKGVTDDTCVLFMSDNGAVTQYGGDNGPWRGGKGSVYEGGIRVPAVMRWPGGGVSGGREVDGMMGVIDVYPTLKRIAEIETDDRLPLDGLDMLDVIRGKDASPKRDWFSYIAQKKPEQIAVHDGTWKLVVQGGDVLDVALDDVPEGMTVELFQLDTDPGESTNRAANEPEIVEQLLKRLKTFRALKLDGVPGSNEGREDFVAPKDWKIQDSLN
jgi:arylsulfatase A-like enzyme